MIEIIVLAVGLLFGSAPEPGHEIGPRSEAPTPQVKYRDSTTLGSPDSGSLQNGVQMPREGRHFFTWDPSRHRSPDPGWRRWASDDTIRTTLRVLRMFGRAHPRAPRVGIGDLSKRAGGYFGDDVANGYGHDSHQNGLDVDVYFPRSAVAARTRDAPRHRSRPLLSRQARRELRRSR